MPREGYETITVAKDAKVRELLRELAWAMEDELGRRVFAAEALSTAIQAELARLRRRAERRKREQAADDQLVFDHQLAGWISKGDRRAWRRGEGRIERQGERLVLVRDG